MKTIWKFVLRPDQPATTVASYPFVGTVQLHGLVFHVFDGGEQ